MNTTNNITVAADVRRLTSTTNTVAADVRRLTSFRATDGPRTATRFNNPAQGCTKDGATLGNQESAINSEGVPSSRPRLTKRCLNADAIKLRHRMIRRARTRARLGRWWMRQCTRQSDEADFGPTPLSTRATDNGPRTTDN